MSSYSRRPRAIRIVLYEDPMLGSDEVRADAIASRISHGTELALYRGDSTFGGKRERAAEAYELIDRRPEETLRWFPHTDLPARAPAGWPQGRD
jgi:hypothetical protein